NPADIPPGGPFNLDGLPLVQFDVIAKQPACGVRSRMRITFVCPIADLSGGFRVIAVYAKRLRDRGHEVLVVSRPPRKPSLRERLRAAYRRRPLQVPPKDAPSHLDGTGVPHRVID